ncbi:MAG: trypsin-like peptidase domain-containing protein [Oscillospiraceae bacterium]|nr:trypsin-like peptidase domain-containing protein [Oscillospiraceae bacterium]
MKSTGCIFTSTGNNGTGFVYKENYVVTNAHVLFEAEDFVIRDAEGAEHEGTVVFTDDGTDIAVIRINDRPGVSAADPGYGDPAAGRHGAVRVLQT